MPAEDLRAARANRDFCTDKTIRTKIAVIVKGKNDLGLFLYEIADCAWMGSSSVRNQRSARTVFRPRNIAVPQQRGAIQVEA